MFSKYLEENFELNIKILQVICYIQLDQDLNLSPFQFSQLDLQPYMFSAIAVKIMQDPDFMNRARISPTFTLPSYQQAVKMMTEHSFSPVPSTEITAPAAEPVVPENLPIVENVEVEKDQLPPNVVALARKELAIAEPVVMITPRQTKRQIRGIQRAIAHYARTGLKNGRTFESTKDKYKTRDFEAGKVRGKYFHPNGPQLQQFPDVDHDIKILSPVVTIDKLIYAPPGSGKSTFNSRGEYYDTDYLPCWKKMHADIALSNLHDKIGKCKESLAIIPSRKCFERRCREKMLDVKEQWYDDVLESAKRATHVIYSDEYLDDIFVTSDVARRFIDSTQ